MIKSISIQNFQSHEHTRLNLDAGVNVIVGSSDSGKTAIIRALRWAIWNRPSGDSIRSNWGGDTLCLVETAEGTVLRFKGKEDRYEVKRGEQRNIVLKAFGTAVPAEVATLLNINEINLQAQLDSPFLLTDTPGAVAAHFNKVAHLDKIDTATSNVNKALREITQRISYLSEQVSATEEELTQFENLDKFEADIEALEELEKTSTAKKNELRKLSYALEQLEDIDEGLESLQGLLELEDLVVNLQVKFTERARLSEVSRGLGRVVNNLLTTEEQLRKRQVYLEKLEERFHKEMPNICPLCDTNLSKRRNENKA